MKLKPNETIRLVAGLTFLVVSLPLNILFWWPLLLVSLRYWGFVK